MRARFKTRLGALTLATALSLGQAASAGQKLSLPGGTTPTGSQQIPNQINYGYPEIEITGPVQGAFYDPSTDFGLTQITGKVRNIAPYNAVVTVNGRIGNRMQVFGQFHAQRKRSCHYAAPAFQFHFVGFNAGIAIGNRYDDAVWSGADNPSPLISKPDVAI